MKSSIFFLLVIPVALFSLDFIEADIYVTPEPAGLCKEALIKSNGTQNPEGSCSSQILGELPKSSQMVSTIIVKPGNSEVIKVNQNFTIRVEVSNLQTGLFSDANLDYYDVPQKLTNLGIIYGHVHVTIQKLIENRIPDPTEFEFFKGFEGIADSLGGLETEVPGLPIGYYRLCTMASSEGHQPVVMPVAKRGAQDDCIRFFVNY
ncbi:hypothetical protein Glove_276g65 [Diversispora epigaea]|uniref:Uncharacterized protein n=1 Tax=Diversispora epigaea TaxID=1348612 RepID=A0A397I4P9_9GLOM|nr:hypothetical protein Glove_276g65 [Diversispora epigaea]